MLVLVVYDIRTISPEGCTRLRRVAKVCESVGRRVQNSVFECLLDTAQLRQLQTRLEREIDPEQDLIRYYNLGNNFQERIMVRGAEEACMYEAPLVL